MRAVFAQIADQAGRLDVLVNNAWGGYARLRNRSANKGFKWKAPFWTQPLALWDEMHRVGVRSNYVAASFAAPMMIAQGSGLIVNISFYAARRPYGNVAYGTAKAATDAILTAGVPTRCMSAHPVILRSRECWPFATC